MDFQRKVSVKWMAIVTQSYQVFHRDSKLGEAKPFILRRRIAQIRVGHFYSDFFPISHMIRQKLPRMLPRAVFAFFVEKKSESWVFMGRQTN